MRNSTKATPIATSSMASTPSAAGMAVTANTRVGDPARDARWRAPRCRGTGSRERPEPGEIAGGDGREPRDELVVRELGDRARPCRRAHRRPLVGIGEQALERIAHRGGSSARRRDRSRRRRRLRASHRCGPAITGDARTPRLRGTRCRSPRLPARPTARGTASRRCRRWRSAARARRRAPGRGTARARARCGRARRSRRARSRPAPAIASCASGRTRAVASMRTSKPLRGTSRLVPRTRGRSASSASAVRTATRSSGVIGRNRSTSTPGGMIDTRERPARGAHRLACGVRARRDDAGRRVQAPRAEPARAGQSAGNRHFGAVHDDEVRRRAQARPERAERQPRVEEDHVGRDLARERVDLARQRRRRQQHRLLACARCGTAARRPIPASPA